MWSGGVLELKGKKRRVIGEVYIGGRDLKVDGRRET